MTYREYFNDLIKEAPDLEPVVFLNGARQEIDKEIEWPIEKTLAKCKLTFWFKTDNFKAKFL